MTRRTLAAALILAALAAAPPALAGAAPPPALAPDASNAVLPNALSNLGVLSGVVTSKTAAYTVQNSDQGGTIALGGSAFYALTVNAPASYANGSRMYFAVANTDRAAPRALPSTAPATCSGRGSRASSSRTAAATGSASAAAIGAGSCRPAWSTSTPIM